MTARKWHKASRKILLMVFLLSFLLSRESALLVLAEEMISFEVQDGRAVIRDGVAGEEASGRNRELFAGFQHVMPGDVLEENVTIENRCQGYSSVKVYLKAVLHDEETNPIQNALAQEKETISSMEDFLSKLSLCVTMGDQVLFDDSPKEKGTLAEPVLLGNLPKGETLTLRLRLEVPLSLGNEYMDRIGETDWVLMAEGIEASDFRQDDTGTPLGETLIQTGQLLWPIPVLGAAGIRLILFGRRKGRQWKTKKE